MELRIQPFPKNNYPKKGLLIKGSSVFTWLHEMEMLRIELSQVLSFPIPSSEPNVLYGCFLIFENTAPNEIGKNSYFQCVDHKFFIPENTTFYPKINPEDWRNIDSEFLIMHPEFGLVKLTEEIDWISLIHNLKQTEHQIKRPLNGVTIPQKIESYTVEMDDEKVLETLQKPQTEEEWMKSLPFDLQKVMKGNKKEIEKYLKYIEKYPDRAVDLGVPLDVMGTSRGDGFSKFKFLENTWLGRLFGGNSEGKSSTYSEKYRWIFWVFLIVVALFRFFMHVNKEEPGQSSPIVSSGKISEIDENQIKPIVAYQSGVTDIDMKIDSMYGKERNKLTKEFDIASQIYFSKNKNVIENFEKKGGRELSKIQEDFGRINTKVNKSKDSLKIVYSQKIVKYLAQREEKIKKKITDSLNKISSGKPADQGIVKSIWKRKQVLIEDSLGRLYGTKEYVEPPIIDPNNAQKVESFEKKEPYSKHDISFSEIIWLVILMTGVVGLYSFIVKRKSLHVGGENIPGGIKIFLIILLVGMLVYIFYPLIEMFGYNWFVWILIICVILLLYRLFSEDKTILKSDKDE